MKITNPLSAPIVGAYAFWHYDLFPNAIGGEITEVFEGDRFTVKGFGTGRGYSLSLANPSFGIFVDPVRGRLIAAELRRLEGLSGKVMAEARRLLDQARTNAIPDVTFGKES